MSNDKDIPNTWKDSSNSSNIEYVKRYANFNSNREAKDFAELLSTRSQNNTKAIRVYSQGNKWFVSYYEPLEPKHKADPQPHNITSLRQRVSQKQQAEERRHAAKLAREHASKDAAKNAAKKAVEQADLLFFRQNKPRPQPDNKLCGHNPQFIILDDISQPNVNPEVYYEAKFKPLIKRTKVYIKDNIDHETAPNTEQQTTENKNDYE